MRLYSNIAQDTVLTADPGVAGTTITGVAFTGWPSPTGGDTALACLDWGMAGVEIVEYTSRTASALNGCTRGVDGTTAGPHNIGATIRHTASGEDFESFVRAADTRLVKTAYLTSPVSLSASATVALPGLNLTVKAGEVYEVDWFIKATVSGGTAGLKPKVISPSGTTGFFVPQGNSNAASNVTQAALSTNLATESSVGFITASYIGWIRTMAVLNITTDGTLGLSVVTGTSAAGSVDANSRVRAVRMYP